MPVRSEAGKSRPRVYQHRMTSLLEEHISKGVPGRSSEDSREATGRECFEKISRGGEEIGWPLWSRGWM